ncbi:MAG TPA: primosomal protein N' [Verrucomicrobiae bacterium]|jgi:primosomal protein N' (replication factor Y)|nr:primosomal protein N' [Verrucomicrobiae bacterium]
MPQYCDVAVPVPLDATFTYLVPEDSPEPVIGGRVIVPFREQRLCGIVTELHDRKPEFTVKRVSQVLDTTAALTPELMQLGRWIAQYYIAPIGEVFRGMLPLSAEFRRVIGYRIINKGIDALHAASTVGSSLRSRKEPEHQMLEYAVLNRLADGEVVREGTLRSSSGASRAVLQTLVRKKWIAREDLSDVRDASRTIQIATLKQVEGKINANQQTIIDYLRLQEGQRASVDALRELAVPRTTLQTLVKRGLVELSEEAAGFRMSGMKPRKLEFLLTKDQKAALEAIVTAVDERKFLPMLLHGVTGSGKTAVYLSAMQSVLAKGRSAILLVPEIGLTPAVAADLHQIFGNEVAILHSALTDDERAEQWKRIRSGESHIVVGTRSAVFAPVPSLSLIVVDEEHDHSYKQEEMPRYHARDVAVMRAKMCDAAVVLGSATPSLETYYNAVQGKYRLLELPERIEKRPLPEVEVLDMREEFQRTKKDEALSRKLIEEIGERLAKQEQVMVLLNRRGYSAFVLCRECGETVQCKNCAIAMTYHKREHRLVCHYCGFTRPAPKTCPKCGSEYVQYLGTGSEKLEHVLHGLFPQARIARLDRDTVRGRDDFERMLTALQDGEIDLLVGTQMIAKGHDVAKVTLVGVVGSDAALSFPDFRAAERTFQLLTQVAGRAGRGEAPGRVVLQTFFPDHYAIQFAAAHDYRGFYEKEIRFRSWMHYPPFNAVSNVLVRSQKLDEALAWSGILGKWFESTRLHGVRVMGPAAAAIVRLKTEYRYHFLLKSPSREKMNSVLRAMLDHASEQKIPRNNLIVDVDALSLI